MTPMFLSNPSPFRVLRRVVIVASLSLAAAAGVSACSSDSATASTELNPLASDVVRDNTTTVASLNAFLVSEADDWAWAGGQFSAPLDQAVLPAATPEVFTWDADATDPPPVGDKPVASKQNGQVFFLVFSSASNPRVLRVYTASKTYTPSDAAWQSLVAVGGPITVTITSATFDNDVLTGDGGPHTGESITFTIQ